MTRLCVCWVITILLCYIMYSYYWEEANWLNKLLLNLKYTI